jgi:hypothetical protein
MKRTTLIKSAVAVLPTALVVWWVVANTTWVDTRIPAPLKGEARVNPFYAVQRFAEALGAKTAWDRQFIAPPTSAVLVLSGWHWTLSRSRREALEHWVESGGRLVVDQMLIGGEAEFERWSGIQRNVRVAKDMSNGQAVESDRADCMTVQEERGAARSAGIPPTFYTLCDCDTSASLTSTNRVEWDLRGESHIQAMRVRVGRGSVTRIIATPFRGLNLFNGHHGWVFVLATQLRDQDEVHFLAEDTHPSLLSLLWQNGAPVVVLTLLLIALILWRDAVRLGPLAEPSPRARRSLAEQVRGTGQFVMRHGSESLHAAAVRALDEAALRRIPGYLRLSTSERTAALARLTGFDANDLAAAIYHPRPLRGHDLHGAIAAIEITRRRTLIERTRAAHGTS